ncbi:DNA polymerase III subunit chi [Ruixingdingia sedimenti]|uniref:DNA polymerase III subunit chi n=1 Tax=Ruixingdingia sedimenti TaxID=3073604 RepID=A0ABU1F939_9RHOB|nr:DNA polymerase III subunit chi [Xinfangfangia sp. LG-4]MDR5652967.1 DNA polymerase III subunit chi [Xinfangfangia sp. LG-4]
MGTAMFYHLTRSAPEALLPQLIGRAQGAGWRVAVRGRDRARLEWLDERLWLVPEDGFLPHGIAGGPHDADQPVLLTDRADIPNGAACLIALDGAEVGAAEAAALERVCILFDAADPAALATARDQWRTLTGAGIKAQYWSEESGRWEKKTER